MTIADIYKAIHKTTTTSSPSAVTRIPAIPAMASDINMKTFQTILHENIM